MPPRRALADVRSTKEASDAMARQLAAAEQLAEALRSDLGRQKALMQSAECEQLQALGARVEALQVDKADALAKLKVRCSTFVTVFMQIMHATLSNALACLGRPLPYLLLKLLPPPP